MTDYLFLVLGIVCAGMGGEFFVRGVVGIARWMRVSAGIIGATVAAFATSSPELSIAISSAMSGKPQISLGDALGSNVVNIALILALALSISGIHCSRNNVQRDFPVALSAPVITGFLCLDGTLSRLDGMLLVFFFVIWLTYSFNEAHKQRNATGTVLAEKKEWKAVMKCLGGLVLLVAAGRLIVIGAKGIALAYGIHEFIIGATVVAVGTSIPELATVVISKLRGHDEVGLGTVLGSNIFNGLLIIAVAAMITPITVNWHEVAVALIFGLVAVVIIYPPRRGFIERWKGYLLLVFYVFYLGTLLYIRL
jgi:cation:H+ antiporter